MYGRARPCLRFFVYGMYNQFNVVTGPPGSSPRAVLDPAVWTGRRRRDHARTPVGTESRSDGGSYARQRANIRPRQTLASLNIDHAASTPPTFAESTFGLEE